MTRVVDKQGQDPITRHPDSSRAMLNSAILIPIVV